MQKSESAEAHVERTIDFNPQYLADFIYQSIAPWLIKVGEHIVLTHVFEYAVHVRSSGSHIRRWAEIQTQSFVLTEKVSIDCRDLCSDE